MISSVFLGDLYADGELRLLGYVPAEATEGYLLRAVRFCVTRTIKPSEDYWLIRVGTLNGTTFTALTEVNLSTGLVSGERRWRLVSDLRLPQGSVVALKAVHRGKPVPIQGLSLVLEYGILGARSN